MCITIATNKTFRANTHVRMEPGCGDESYTTSGRLVTLTSPSGLTTAASDEPQPNPTPSELRLYME